MDNSIRMVAFNFLERELKIYKKSSLLSALPLSIRKVKNDSRATRPLSFVFLAKLSEMA